MPQIPFVGPILGMALQEIADILYNKIQVLGTCMHACTQRSACKYIWAKAHAQPRQIRTRTHTGHARPAIGTHAPNKPIHASASFQANYTNPPRFSQDTRHPWRTQVAVSS